jgi:hypothetical protein
VQGCRRQKVFKFVNVSCKKSLRSAQAAAISHNVRENQPRTTSSFLSVISSIA